MRALLVTIILVGSAGAASAGDNVAACQARQAEMSKKVDACRGEAMTKRIMQADLERATRELIEGDADECMEALDHADKLLKSAS
jgi:hypothetical protein